MSSTQLTQVNPEPKASALAIMAGRLSVDPGKLLDTLKATCFKGASNEEMLALVAVSNRYGLDPLTKQIYAFPSKGGITPVVSVDGWLHILNSQPQFDGIEFHFEDGPDGKPASVTAVVYRKDRTHATKVTEYFAECFRPTEPWRQFPRRMLRHKAVKEAVRVAFGISGITDEDEARDIARNVAVFEKARVEEAAKPAVAVELLPAAHQAPEETKAANCDQPEVVAEPPKKRVRYHHIKVPQEAAVVVAKPEPSDKIKELERRVFEYEPRVNSFLASRGMIAAGQTFRDISDEAYLDRVLLNTEKFLLAVKSETKPAEEAAEQKEAA